MGGASVQIAFVPGGDVTEHLFPVHVTNRRYLLYVHSYLGYGQSSVVDRIKTQLEADNQASDIIHHPCMLRGAQCLTCIRITWKMCEITEIVSVIDTTVKLHWFIYTVTTLRWHTVQLHLAGRKSQVYTDLPLSYVSHNLQPAMDITNIQLGSAPYRTPGPYDYRRLRHGCPRPLPNE